MNQLQTLIIKPIEIPKQTYSKSYLINIARTANEKKMNILLPNFQVTVIWWMDIKDSIMYFIKIHRVGYDIYDGKLIDADPIIYFKCRDEKYDTASLQVSQMLTAACKIIFE